MKKQLLNPPPWRWLLVAIALMVTFQVHSQGIIVKGKVSSSDGESIPGANVAVQNTSLGTVTGVDGTYTIQLPDENQTLVFSFIGFVSQTVPVSGRSVINIQLETDIQALAEVVIIGYGSVKKTDLTGSVGQVNVGEMIKAPVGTFTEALAG
ncbi:MAG: carboxypeptidase-like regulatory domain-containing protein, partial [Cyclobacteriaceae bacterium]